MSVAVPSPPRSNPGLILTAWLFGIITVSAISIALGLAFGVSGPDIPMLLWAIATMAVCAIPLALDSVRPNRMRHIAFSMMSIGFGLRFGLPVLTYYIPAQGPIDSPDLPQSNLMPPDIAYAQALLFLGFAMFILGYALPVGRKVAQAFPAPRYDWTDNASILAALALLSAGWFIYLGAQFHFLPRTIVSGGIIGAFTDATLIAPAILAIVYLRSGSKLALALILIIVPLTSGINFFTGYKRLMLAPPALVGLMWIVYQRKLSPRWFLMGFLALLILYPSAAFYREVILDNNTRTMSDVFANPGPALDSLSAFLTSSRGFDYVGEGFEATGKRIDGIGHAAVIIRDTPSIVPFQGGWTIALAPITYIPRALWPEKPVVTIGSWIIDNYRIIGREIDSSIGPTWVGEFYLNYGFWGIPPGMFLLGLIFRVVHESLVRRMSTTLALTLETVVIYNLLLTIPGSIAGVLNMPIFAAIPIIAIHFVVRLAGGVQPASADRHSPYGTEIDNGRRDQNRNGFETPYTSVS